MLEILAWLLISYCSYTLFFTRMNALTIKWGGYVEYMKIYCQKEDEELKLAPDSFFSATIKSMFILLSVFLWPLVLSWVLWTYCYVDYEQSLEDDLK